MRCRPEYVEEPFDAMDQRQPVARNVEQVDYNLPAKLHGALPAASCGLHRTPRRLLQVGK
jgi:hypothetical protein